MNYQYKNSLADMPPGLCVLACLCQNNSFYIVRFNPFYTVAVLVGTELRCHAKLHICARNCIPAPVGWKSWGIPAPNLSQLGVCINTCCIYFYYYIYVLEKLDFLFITSNTNDYGLG